MKKQDLKKVYSNVPQDFHNSVVRTLNSLEDVQKSTVRPKSKIFRTAVACALIIAVGAVGAVTAAAVYPMVASREGNYGMTLELEATGSGSAEDMNLKLSADSTGSPEYVKMNIGYLPQGVVEDQGKYSLNGEHEEQCFTFDVMRVAENVTVSDVNILDYEQFEVHGNPAVLAHSSLTFAKSFYIFFEDECALVCCYVTDDVSDDEIKKVMESISFTSGTEENNDGGSLSQAREQESGENNVENALQNIYDSYIERNTTVEYSVIPCGQSVGYSDDVVEENAFKCSVDSIEVLDNISELDRDNFDNNMFNLSEYADENGTLLSYTREIYSYGDGVNTTKELISSETMNRKLIYVTATVTNTSDEEQCFYLGQIGMEWLRENNGELQYVGDLEEYLPDKAWCGEINYIDNNNVDTNGFKSGYYFMDVPANSSKTVHLGFFSDEDMIDELYVTFDGAWCDSIFDEETNTFVLNDSPSTSYGYACIKVD